MNLLIDIGNSRIKWALAKYASLVETGAIRFDGDPSVVNDLPYAKASALYMASVAAEHTSALVAEQARAHRLSATQVRTGASFGALRNGYSQPAQLGVDRWMGCIAAYSRGGGSALIADAGTALTLDWVGADGAHGGGLIAPGVGTMRASLQQSTALRLDRSAGSSVWLARDTSTAMASGTQRCLVALLNDAVASLAPERLLLTGGDADVLAAMLNEDWTIAPHLVLEGLAIYAASTNPG